MDFTDFNDSQLTEKQERPSFLTVLSILSFISIGFSLIASLFELISGPMTTNQLEENKIELLKQADEMRSLDFEGGATMLEKIQRMTEALNANFYSASIVSIVILLVGLFGVISMWRARKIGFHFYIIYSLLSIIQIYFFISASDIPLPIVLWNLFFSALFTIMYSRNLKWMS
jgi:hypothetical protein